MGIAQHIAIGTPWRQGVHLTCVVQVWDAAMSFSNAQPGQCVLHLLPCTQHERDTCNERYTWPAPGRHVCAGMKRACMRRRWNGARSSYAAQGPTAIGANDAFVQRKRTCALSEASGTLLAVRMHVCAFVVCMYLGVGLDEVCSKTDGFRPSQLCRRNLKLGSKRLAPNVSVVIDVRVCRFVRWQQDCVAT